MVLGFPKNLEEHNWFKDEDLMQEELNQLEIKSNLKDLGQRLISLGIRPKRKFRAREASPNGYHIKFRRGRD